MKRGQKRTKNQKRRDAKALRLIQDPPAHVLDMCEFALNNVCTFQEAAAAHHVYHLSGTKADLITLKLWS